MDQPLAVFASCQRYSDADALAQALNIAKVAYVPLGPRTYEAELTGMQLGTLALHHVRDDAHVAQASTMPGTVTMLFGLGSPGDAIVNGVPVECGVTYLLGPGGPLHGICRSRLDWASLTLPIDEFAPLIDLWGASMVRPNEARTMRFESWAMEVIDAGLRAAIAHAPRIAAGAHSRADIHGLHDGLRETLGSLAGALDAEPRTPQRAAADALRIVRHCDDYLHQHIHRPIYTQELCDAVGVSPTRLHQAFVAAAAMTPHTYLKRRRLGLVRRLLRSGGGDTGLVKSVALAHGFWHLGHFARDYHAQFGEFPSDTLASSQPHAAR